MENVNNILLSRGCPVNQVEAVVKKIENLSDRLKPAMDEWLKNESMPLAEVDGYSTSSLMERFTGMQYPAALFLLDWLIKDPETAQKTINKGIR